MTLARNATSLSCLLFLSLASACFASGAAPRRLDEGSVVSPPVDRSGTASPACTLEPGPLAAVSVAYEAPDSWKAIATRVHVNSCSACAATGALTLTDVSLRIRWVSAGTAQVIVSVIGGTGTGACLVPDETNVLCPPATYPVSSSGAGGIVYTLPFADGCCITSDAFVLVQFVGLADPNQPISHGITLSTGPCVACDQYIESQTLYPTFTEVCSTSIATPYWISVGANCCTPTPTRRSTWGELKIRSR